MESAAESERRSNANPPRIALGTRAWIVVGATVGSIAAFELVAAGGVGFGVLLVLVAVAVGIGWDARPVWRLEEVGEPALAPPRRVKSALPDLRFVRIEAGTFVMGSPPDEHRRDSDEVAHRVTISSAFEMAATQVSRGQWVEIMGSAKQDWESNTGNLPATHVSWFDAIKFCNELSRREERTPFYEFDESADEPDVVRQNQGADGYRLPTEAEWEYACRAGTTTPFSFGETITTAQANFNGDYPYREGDLEGEDRGEIVAVGSFPANAWGLHEMHGNVWEWCWDRLAAYPTAPQTDPAGPEKGSGRVLRGGSFISSAWDLRSAFRFRLQPGTARLNYGFRCVRPARRQHAARTRVRAVQGLGGSFDPHSRARPFW